MYDLAARVTSGAETPYAAVLALEAWFRQTGGFTYDFPSDLAGPVTFTYRASDGTADGNVATVTLTRVPNTAPVAANDTYPLPATGPLVVPAAAGVLANDTDADGAPR